MDKILIIVGVLVGGIAVFMGISGIYSVNDSSSEATGQNNEESIEEVSKLQGEGTFAELLMQGKDIRCQVSYEPDEIDGSVYGEVFISNEHMRADVTMTSSFGNTETSIIHTKEKGYVWGSAPMGEIAVVFDVDANEPSGTDTGNDAFDLDENVMYSCDTWNPDRSLFVPPANIEFVDLQAQMEAQMNASFGGDTSAQCGMCEQIPDEAAKAQCLSALQCI